MLNICGIYIVSLETGDVEVVRTCSRYNKATTCLKEVLEKYIDERGLRKCSLIVSKEDFSLELLKKNKKFPDGYCFKQGKNSITIYKKTTDLGYLRNSVEIHKISKIGIVDISVQLPKSNYEENFLYNDDMFGDDFNDNNEYSEEDFDIVDPVNKATNMEHGKHVCFIEELKNTLAKRRQNMNLNSSENTYELLKEENDELTLSQEFISNLNSIKNGLNCVPAPEVKYGFPLGKVVEERNIVRSYSYNNLTDYDYEYEYISYRRSSL